MKPLFVISCPIDCYSGYSSRSRDIVKSLLKLNEYDIKILPQRWGNCTQGFLKQDNPEHKAILDCFLTSPQLPRKPEVWCQVTVPNEMQRVGDYNILITAGIETDLCSMEWIEGCNRADLVLTSSEHSKKVFLNTKGEKRDKINNQLIEKIECTTPIEVLFEGIDTEIFNKDKSKLDCDLNKQLDNIKEDFNFLFVGHWLQGGFGEDRKNVGQLIKTFLETFKDKSKQPGLILKTNSASTSIMDRDSILSKIEKIKQLVPGKLPNIYLLHGELKDEEMNELYNHPKIKSFVSFTKGEGFGRPLLESSIYQKPILVSNWSGQLDFLKPEFNTLLLGQLKQISPSTQVPGILIPESKWFEVDTKKASIDLQNVYTNYKDFIGNAKRQSYFSKLNFSLEKMEHRLKEIIDEKIPKRIDLVLPKLVKIK